MPQIAVFVSFSALWSISHWPPWTIWPFYYGCHWYFLILGIVFDHFERFERVCLSCCHFRGLQSMPQIEIFVSFSALWIDFPLATMDYLILFRGCHWYFLILGIVLHLFDRFEMVCLSCCPFRALQIMLQIAIYLKFEVLSSLWLPFWNRKRCLKRVMFWFS